MDTGKLLEERLLQKLVRRSLVEGRTKPLLRRLVITCATEAALDHFNGDFSAQCVAVSTATVALLRELGMESNLMQGEVSFAQAWPDRVGRGAFGGHGDGAYHVWVVREKELIDITISQQHQAPGMAPGGFPMPFLWWDDYMTLPNSLCYLPFGRVKEIRMSHEHQQQGVDSVVNAALARLESRRNQPVDDLPPVTWLAGIPTLNQLLAKRDPWVCGAQVVESAPLPPWVLARMEQIKDPDQRRSLLKGEAE